MEKMKKKEIIIISSFLIVALMAMPFLKSDKHYGAIYCDDELLLRFDINVDNTYQVTGKYGQFTLEVLDGRWRAIDVDCPNHDCEKMGWSSLKFYVPIICLPNHIKVVNGE